MNNTHFILTNDDELGTICGLIRNEPFPPTPGEEPGTDYIQSRITAALKSKYNWDVTKVNMPSNWKDWHKPIQIKVFYKLWEEPEYECNMSLTIAWEY